MSPDPHGRGELDVLVGEVHAAVAASAAWGTTSGPDTVVDLVRRLRPLAPPAIVEATSTAVLRRVDGLGPLEALLDDEDVTEVMVNGPGAPVWIERRGILVRTDVVLDLDAIQLAIERIVAPLGLRVDRTSPTLDARLADGSRVNVVVPPLAVDGPCVTIRRFGARAIPLADLCPPGVADLLSWAVAARLNLVAVGGTGSGKTTLLNALAAAIPAAERIVTVEDAAELRLPHGHVVRLECRPTAAPGADAPQRTTLRELVRNALRMRPDRLIVGEVRGSEALDLLQAMNTGHEGALSTCHANNPVDALARLETMCLLAGSGLPLAAVRGQLTASLDLVVHVSRRADGTRRVVAVAEVAPDRRGVRHLADLDGLHALPTRPARATDAPPPDPRWATPC